MFGTTPYHAKRYPVHGGSKLRKLHLVEITKGQQGWKGTWYRTGQRHFVYQDDPWWPNVSLQRWQAFEEIGGISEGDCRVLRGPIVWLKCWFKSRYGKSPV